MLKRVSEYINIYIYIHIYVVGFALRIFKRLILIVNDPPVVHACESKRISVVITAMCNMECAKQVHLASTQTI